MIGETRDSMLLRLQETAKKIQRDEEQPQRAVDYETKLLLFEIAFQLERQATALERIEHKTTTGDKAWKDMRN